MARNGMMYGKIVERKIWVARKPFKLIESVRAKSQRSNLSSTSVYIAGTIPVAPSITNIPIKTHAKLFLI